MKQARAARRGPNEGEREGTRPAGPPTLPLRLDGFPPHAPPRTPEAGRWRGTLCVRDQDMYMDMYVVGGATGRRAMGEELSPKKEP